MKKVILVSLLSILFVPLLASAAINTNLYYGVQNKPQVQELQDFLIAQGFLSGNTTGNFYSLTLKAVKAYQTSVGISPTGYVGKLTEASINNALASELSASNQEAQSETGTIPPSITPSTVAGCSSASGYSPLTGQLCLGGTTTQTPVSTPTQTCTHNWRCGDWGTCTNSQITRTCTDLNSCGITMGQPILTQSCVPPTSTLSISCLANQSSVQTNQPITFSSSVAILGGTGTYIYSWTGDCVGNNSNCTNSFSQAGTKTANLTVNYGSQTENTSCSVAVNCTPNWQTGIWGTCTNSQQTRNVVDSNSCGTTLNEPPLTRSCTPPPPVCTPNWQCGGFGACVNGQKTQTCADLNNCGVTTNEPITTQSCLTTPTPTLTIAKDTSTNIQSYAVAGSTNNNLLDFIISTNSSQGVSLGGSIITVTDNISNNSGGLTSFKNLTLWQGATEISGAVQMTLGSNGVGAIVFPLSSSSPITVQSNSPLALQIHGDVSPAGLAALNSVHIFSIAGSSIIGSWQNQGSPTNITATGTVTGSSMVILPYYATLDASGSGNNSNLTEVGGTYQNAQALNVKIATINVGADSLETGSATVNSVTLEFTGNGIFNQNNPTNVGAFPINLLDSGGDVLNTQQCVPVPSITSQNQSGQANSGLWVGTATCSITFPLNITDSSGSSTTYTLQAPDPIIQKPDTGNGQYQNVQLFLEDVNWTDGTTSNIRWNASNQPTQIFNYTYQ